MLHQQIKNEIKEAMIKKDALKLSVLRNMITAFTNELISQKSAEPTLSDEDAITVIKRLAKQRKDSIEQFTKANRMDLAQPEKDELAIIEKYLPALIGKEEIRKIATKKKEEMGISDKAKIGVLTGAIMKELKGNADGADVKTVVDSLFA